MNCSTVIVQRRRARRQAAGNAGILLPASALPVLYAASPPDVRKVRDLPKSIPFLLGLCPYFSIIRHSPKDFLSPAGRSVTFRTSGGEAACATVAGHIVDLGYDGHSTPDEKGPSFRIVNLSGCFDQLDLLSPSRYPSRADSTNANIGTHSANCSIARANNSRKHGRCGPPY